VLVTFGRTLRARLFAAMLQSLHRFVKSEARNRTMGRVLVIDGDAVRRVALATALGSASHEVEIAATAETGAYLAHASRPDLVVIESMLPDGTGAELCGTIRRDSLVSAALLLVIGAAVDEVARVGAFEAGADDYVVRPFSTRELLLRVRALLRRVSARTPPDVVSLGTVRIDRGTRRVTSEGKSVALTRRELDLLLRLVDGRGRVLGRDTIVADVWPDDAPSERVVDTTLKRLRKKLPLLGRRIRTIRGVGYELTEEPAKVG
jgi:two-component system phosphate regulon response regulator PhoB